MLQHSAFPVAECKRLAANDGDERVPLWMQCNTLKETRRIDKATLSLRSRAVQFDLDLARFIRCRIEQVEICASVVDDPPSIGGRKTCIVFAVPRVPLKILTGRQARC